MFYSCVGQNVYIPMWLASVVAGKGFANHYRQLASDRYYIKLDDDIMYIKEGAIEAMLREKLSNRFWIISANVINHSGKSSVHT